MILQLAEGNKLHLFMSENNLKEPEHQLRRLKKDL
jgi:hypothetical protein